MKTEYRAIIAVAASAAFFVLWTTVISPPKKVPPAETAVAQQQAAATAAPAATAPATIATAAPDAKDPQAALPAKSVTLKNDLVEMTLTTEGGVLTAWKTLGYHVGTDQESPLIDLAAATPGAAAPLSLAFAQAGVAIPANPRFELLEATDDAVTMRWRSPEAELTKKVTLKPGSYQADVEVTVVNPTDKAFSLKPVLSWSAVNPPKKKGGFFSFLKAGQDDVRMPVYYVDGKTHRAKDLKPTQTISGGAYWAGIESRYFISAVIPRIQGEGLAVEVGGGEVAGAEAGTHAFWAGIEQPAISVPPGGSASSTFSIYAGPKEIDRLKALNVHLDEAIDYGWFTVIAVPILYLLKFFYGIVHNYGIAIILLTILIKLLLHPINVKSLKSMKAMQQLQPRLKELQVKYKEDKQKLNAETMALFRAHKVNPMGGCLPMAAQLPIYIALYKVLWSSIELYHAPFFWFYRDLSAPDPYLITPILLGVFMLAQQLLTPSTTGDPAQKKMMMMMPIMFTGFMLFLPVGLVIYILINTVMSVTQQWMMNKGIGFRDIITGRARAKLAKA